MWPRAREPQKPRRELTPDEHAAAVLAERYVGQYRPLNRRRRFLIALLAVATAIAVVLLLLDPPGGVQRKRAPLPESPRCAPGQTEGCVGGKSVVIVGPAITPASAPAR